MKEEITKVREVLANTEDSTAEAIKDQTNELQQKSLKLFEMAYKKVSGHNFWHYETSRIWNYVSILRL